MSKEETLVNLLLNATGLRPEAYEKQQGVNKCIVYQRVSTAIISRTHDKQSTERVRFQLDCYGVSHSDSRNLAEQVKTALDMNTTDFQVAWLANDFVTKESGVQPKLFRSILDFYII